MIEFYWLGLFPQDDNTVGWGSLRVAGRRHGKNQLALKGLQSVILAFCFILVTDRPQLITQFSTSVTSRQKIRIVREAVHVGWHVPPWNSNLVIKYEVR